MNLSKVDQLIPFYHSLCEGYADGPENKIENDLDVDTGEKSEEEQDQLYAMVTKSQSKQVTKERPGNINRLLSNTNDKG